MIPPVQININPSKRNKLKIIERVYTARRSLNARIDPAICACEAAQGYM